MKKKYKLKMKKKNKLSVFSIGIIVLILILSISIAYSIWSTNLTINGNVVGKKIKVGTIEFKGMTVTIDDQGIVTVNGTLNTSDSYIVKISNGLEAQNGNVSTAFENWYKTDPTILANSGDNIVYKVNHISGEITSSKKEFNVCLRDQSNISVFLKNALCDNIFESTSMATSNVRTEYLYLRGGLSCNNYKFSTEIHRRVSAFANKDLYLYPGSLKYNGVTVKVNEDGSVVLNGKATTNIFFKLSEGLLANGSIVQSWNADGKVIVPKESTVKLGTKSVSGTGSGEVNLCLRYEENVVVPPPIKLINGETSNTYTLTSNAKICYLYVRSGSILNEYTIVPYISKMEDAEI